ncbi:mediator of RNA polymerase II transcription subunit 33A-like isoform X2 [Vitis riparia]|uniref:mediator of RNA polymerase II transcription subunit 33A-like isoform X2 n=1 Tax=Vitis riparia TaxID=96939 RepID=UPI00155A7DEC|nr:mediator of RNA polymerase II transcription subunit 33A-like isoform X2 [Vitis riparia]
MEMASNATLFEERVKEALKRCQERREPPLIWATEMVKCLDSAGLGLPSVELGQVLVSQLCFAHNSPSMWKFLDHALSSRLLSPLHVLSLLTSRIIPHRWSQPEAYRLYLELLSRYAFSFDPVEPDASKERIIKSVDAALQLSKTYQVHVLELGHTMVLFFFSIVVGLLDSTLDDWGLPVTFLDRASGVARSGDYLNMDIDSKGNKNFKQSEHREQMRRTNSFLAMEVLGTLTENRKAKVLLRLVHLNMPEGFNGLLRRIQFLEAHKLASSILKSANQLLVRLSANIRGVLDFEYQLNKRQLIGMLIDIGSNKLVSGCNFEAVQSACWVPFDIYMENVMDVKQLPVRSTIVILRETIRTLQGFNRASWQETFLALWLSALRLVQRERDPLEGPIPHLESRLCMLLSIAPLAITQLLEDEVNSYNSSSQGGREYGYTEIGYGHEMDRKCHASRKHGLISSLQVLGHFSALLCPPSSIADAANLAAAKAAGFISNSKNGKDSLGGGSHGNTIVKSGGNMRHLIVEACIARKLIDTSAYFWPGYVSASVISMSDSSPIQGSPWSTFMEGAPLTGPLIDALIAIPASSLAELEKLYHVALNGSEEEKSAAAKILCGASLRRGWNIQEHVVHYMVKLLSPPIPPNFTGTRSHLIDYLPMLSAILFEASSIDTVHILSFHGVVPEVAAALMPLCEAFGSVTPTSNHKSSMGDELSIYMVFSSAFLFLLRLWKFYKPPLEQCISGRGRAIGSELTLEYLLILRNNRIASHNSAAHDETSSSLNRIESTSDKPVYIDSYPKLRAWYCQNRSCIASTLSGLCNGSPVHQVANKILNMIYWKMTKSGASSGNPSTPSGSSISGSTASTGEDAYQRPMLPAWEVLEAVPLVLEAILTACAHGILSSRDLTTEVSRGIWKLVPMNGKDWPSPAANLLSVESEIKEILAAMGVDAPRCSPGDSTAMLPLPMAALVSLTITFKLDKRLEYIHAVAGTSLANCASSCPWPSMPIIGSLWVQKVRRWHNFIVGSCSLSVFRQDKKAVAQLLRSCFTSFLGLFHVSKSPLAGQNGVVGLLGDINWAHCPSIAPGLLYLRSCRTIHNVQYVNHVIIGLVAEFARELASRWASKDSQQLKSSQSSLALATTKVKEVATLGASLLCVTGGIQLVQELYQETLPTWLLSTREEKLGEVSSVSRIMEGYAMAYLLVLSGSFIWGLGARPPSWTFSIRARIVRTHLDFLAGVLEGNISLGCDPATWKSYVSCLVGLLVSLAPTWIRDVKRETLRKLANGLRGWHECELALSLLEKGGPATLGSAAELVNVIN